MDVRFFPAGVRVYSGGIPLQPQSASVVQEANGDYRLMMDFIRDDRYNRHKLLKNGAQIVCNVPSKCLPIRHVETTTGTVERYQTMGETRQTTKTVLDVAENILKAQIDGYMRTHPKATHTDAYNAVIGDMSHPETVYSYDDVPCYKDEQLKDVLSYVTTGYAVNAIKKGTGWVFGVTKQGITGYFKESQLYYVGTVEGEVWSVVDDATTVSTRQPFRIVKTIKSDGKSIRLTARHIYFDASAVQLEDHEFTNTTLDEVCEYLNGNGVIKYHAGAVRYITIDASDNAVAVASDICENNDLQLVRDGYDAYFIESGSSERGINISTGVNAKSLKITESVSDLVTRWIPVVNDVEQDPIDSEYINDYPLIYVKRVEGKTLEECQKQINDDIKNSVDLPSISVSTKCAQGTIDNVSVFDAATIHDGLLDEDLTAHVNSIEYDVLNGHVVEVDLGDSRKRLTATVFSSVRGSWQSAKKV